MPDQNPQNVAAEEALLGSFLIDPQAIADINGSLKPHHFYMMKHRFIYEAMRAVHDAGTPLDFLTLASELERRNILEKVGGAVYLSQLIAATPSAMNARSYAREVIEAWRRREILSLASEIAQIAYDKESKLNEAAGFLVPKIEMLFGHEMDAAYQSFAQLAPTLAPITWLWPAWIPRGMITLLGAVPGAGKSMIALDLAKRIIHGEAFPDGKPGVKPGNVIYVDAELVPQILKERAEAWRMDTSKLFLMLPKPHDAIDFGREEYRAQLRQMAETLKPALIIIDSLSSISSKGENNIEDIRSILSFLNELASTSGAGLVLIHHLRKRGGQQMALPELDVSIDDFRGSSHIIAMSRSVLALSVIKDGPEAKHNGPRKLQSVKSNVGAYPDPLGCEFLPLHPTGVYLNWTMEAPKPYHEPSKAELCAAWLQDQLAPGPLSLQELCSMGELEGYSKPTIWRARQLLGTRIIDTDGRQSPHNKWQLNNL